ncbi:zf-HC2 domain-containing protein [uncultured Oscillibacter sp.]|uniref:anti-sigma factor family protein n=1 Tax=uncultured Oscillibacter sp. TaxID=876091 RepID=UPI0025D42916|nr:zf-HC2 domain-containing protein [uncultured Oscillibacter sp.]
MKYCEEYAALLDSYVDGELEPAEMVRVRDHLETCPGCRTYVDDILVMRAGFPEAEDTVAPEGFAAGVMERIQKERIKEEKLVRMRKRSSRRWAGTLTALAACCGLVIWAQTGLGNAGSSNKAPAGADLNAPEAYCGITEDEETGEAEGVPQTPQASLKEEAAAEDRAEIKARTTAGEKSGADSYDYGEYAGDSGAPTEAAAPRSVSPALAASAPKQAEALRLSAAEAGTLLDGFEPVWEDDAEQGYELTAQEYAALLEALGREAALPEGENIRFLVVVTEP